MSNLTLVKREEPPPLLWLTALASRAVERVAARRELQPEWFAQTKVIQKGKWSQALTLGRVEVAVELAKIDGVTKLDCSRAMGVSYKAFCAWIERSKEPTRVITRTRRTGEAR